MAKHKDTPVPVLSFAFCGGLLLIGMLTGTKLITPRVFMFVEDGNKIKMAPLPCNPPFVPLVGYFSYPVPDEETVIIGLYKKVTSVVVGKMQERKEEEESGDVRPGTRLKVVTNENETVQ